MSILVGTTKKIAVKNDQPDPYYAVAEPIWHTPIIRVGSNGGKLSQPGTNGFAARWNLNRGDMRLNNRTGSWTGGVLTRWCTAAEAGDVSPSGLVDTSNKRMTYNSSVYPWASNIGFVKGNTSTGMPDYIRLPTDFDSYVYDLIVDMFITVSATGTSYSAGQFLEFGILYSFAASFSTSNTWYRTEVNSSKLEIKPFGKVGDRYTGSVSKGELTAGLAYGQELYTFVVPFINDNGALTQAGSEYITDIMLGIKCKH